MCGIAWIITKKGADVFDDIADILSMMRHRGPEGFGVSTAAGTKKHQSFSHLNQDKLSGNAGIGHCLLSITGHDLKPFSGKRFAKNSYGLQPFSSQTKKISLAHNGQIYNYAELTNKKVQSDSEAILHFFENYPSIEKAIPEFMTLAIGKYAVAINSGNSLYAFRDVLGIKPLWFG